MYGPIWVTVPCTFEKKVQSAVAGDVVPYRKEREKGAEHLLEKIIAENLSNLEKETNMQIQKEQRV